MVQAVLTGRLMMVMVMMMLFVDVEEVTSDVLGMMMAARDLETCQGMSDDELRDQVMTLMLAGHEVSIPTSITALCATSSTIVCTGTQHQHTWSDSLRPTSEIVGRRCLCSADTTTLQVPSTRRATLRDRAFPVAAARAWNSLPLETRACSSLLTFRRETKSHLFRQSYG